MSLPEVSEAPLPLHKNNNETSIQKLLEDDSGYVVGRLNNELLRFNSDAHFLTISPTGGGKTTGSIIPNLLDHPGSSFVIDIRGETVAKTATAKRLQGHHVVVLDPYNITEGLYGIDTYNPFDRITADLDDHTNDDRIQRLVQALMFDPQGRKSNEPIWDNATKNLLTGLIKYCVHYMPRYRKNLNEILDILNYALPELEMFVDELLAVVENNPNAQEDQHIKGLVKILTENKATTKITDNAVVQAQTYLNWVGNRSFKDMINRSTFTFEDLQESKMTVYLVIPEEFIDNCASWARIIIESAVFSTKDVFKTKGISTSHLPQEERVLFLLDELPAFGQLDIISKGMATLRGRGINLWLFIQNISQLQDVYEEKKARTIIGNASCIQVFKSDELEELEYFSKLIGEEFVDVKSVSIGETKTEGSSVSQGNTHTINNSESFSQTKGTTDSYSEATGRNWGESVGTSKNKSKTTNRNHGGGSGSNWSDNWGKNKNKGNTYKRNLLFSTRVGSNDGRGSSSGSSYGGSDNKNWSKGKSFTKGSGTSHTKSSGYSETKTESHSVNESTSQSRQKGYSDAKSETTSSNESIAYARNVSVKKERMKIETVRTLREKLSTTNQLLLVKGEHPFFCQKMSYFAKFSDVERYIFPDFMALITLDVSDVLVHRSITDQYLELLKQCELYQEKLKEWKEQLTYTVITKFKNLERIHQFQTLIKGEELSLYKDFKALESLIPLHQGEYEYSAVALLGIISCYEFEEMQEQFNVFRNTVSSIIADLEAISYSYQEGIEAMVNDFKRLPINDLTTFNGNSVRDSISKYNLSDNDISWIVSGYIPLFEKLLNTAESELEKLFQFGLKNNQASTLFHKTALDIEESLLGELERRIEKENAYRHEFFISQQEWS